MRPPVCAIVPALALLLACTTARARQDDPRLPALFDQLKGAPSAAEAAPIEARIWAVWAETPEPASAALFTAADSAVARRDYPEALDRLTTLVQRDPDFAEAWNKRATVYYLAGNYRASVDDIRRTLALEPRHFGALSGLGLIYLAIGDPDAAVRSFKAALAIDPYLEGARAQVGRLQDEVEGAPL